MYLVITALSVLYGTAHCQEPVKICVPEKLEETCHQMEQDVPDKFTCVIGRDWVDCARKMQRREADLANLDITSIYMAGKYFDAVPIAAEIKDGDLILYDGVALVLKESDIASPSDLKGRSACHTALGRTAWILSLSRLMSNGIIHPETCAEGSQKSVSFLKMVDDFFAGGSCAGGIWSMDPLIDRELKRRFPGLCSRCQNPESCSSNDHYFGYQGAIRCLVEGSGDVSFTSILAVKEFLSLDPSLADKVELLCPEGGRVPLTLDGEGLESCFWGFRPTGAFVTSKENFLENGARLLQVIAETQTLYGQARVTTPNWYHKTFLSYPDVDGADPVDVNRNNYRSYLGDDYVYAIEGPACRTLESQHAVWCVVSEEEKLKCEDYAIAASSRGLCHKIGCVMTTSKAACMELVGHGHAHLVTLDGGDVYKAGRYFNLQPVSAELYGESDATYFAVAVLKSSSNVTRLSQLRGLRSCHTGIGKTAGWIVPVGLLLRDGSLTRDDQCDQAANVANFFTGGSCVPGANDTKYNPGRSHADQLCQQCIGDTQGRFRCSRDAKERYSGYEGAFRCLAEGSGDVAFVKHTTAMEYTDRHSNDDWTKDLRSSDFQLLCGQGGNKPIQAHANCNLAKVPSHYVMTDSSATPEDRLRLAKLLADSSEDFYDKYTSLFRIFGSYGRGEGQQNLLFKDSTTSLKAIDFTSSYIDALGQDFYDSSAAVDPKACQRSNAF